jgi:hypothetical protein
VWVVLWMDTETASLSWLHGCPVRSAQRPSDSDWSQYSTCDELLRHGCWSRACMFVSG